MQKFWLGLAIRKCKLSCFGLITQVIIEILLLSLAKGCIISCLNDPTGDDYSAGALCFKFFYVSDKEIDKIKENAIPNSTKDVAKFKVKHFRADKLENCSYLS